MGVHFARVYDAPGAADGRRILVDRLWPRGVRSGDPRIHEWCKDVAPSTELRHWYGHDPVKLAEFTARYSAELAQPEPAAALAHLHELAEAGPLTLLSATKTIDISHAAVLAALLGGPAPGPQPTPGANDA